jgi:uncharacterized membrane protein
MAISPAPDSTTDRLEAFSDAVIAIAITLLVLEISVPNVEDGHLFDALLDQWPSYLAFIISFVVIGIMWVSHHSMFQRIAWVDRSLLFINLILLLGIAFLPFPTALLAEYVAEGGQNAHVSAAIYSATMTVIGCAFAGMWGYLLRRPQLLVEGMAPAGIRRALHRSMVSPVVYALTIGLAFINALACFVVYLLLAAYFVAGPSSRALTPTDAADVTE